MSYTITPISPVYLPYTSQVSYTIVISALAKAGELDEAAALLGRMEESHRGQP